MTARAAPTLAPTFAMLAATLMLAACTQGSSPRPATLPAASRAIPQSLGLERVIGQDARALAGLFGAGTLDLREGPARKLQWQGPACVLDAYLYPPAGGGEPRATWIDARTPAGADMDKASCVAALARTPAMVPPQRR